MSDACCAHAEKDAARARHAGYRRILWIVILLNGLMFVVEMISGFRARSVALNADALDFLGDAATYGMSLYVLDRTARWRAAAALIKGTTLAMLALGVLALGMWRFLALTEPVPAVMGTVALLALATNIVAALLLLRFRSGDSNVRSVWLCSRNDAIGNVAVLLAAFAVAATASPWPDLIVAGLMACLFLHSSFLIVRQAHGEWAAAAPAGSGHVQTAERDPCLDAVTPVAMRAPSGEH